MSTELTNDKDALAKVLKTLDQRELQAYRYFYKAKQEKIPEEVADGLFALYLQGKSCEEIRRVHGGYSFGQVVAARIDGDWDARRISYRQHLEKTVPDRARQTHVETVDFLADMLNATQTLTRERLRLYSATKDEKHLAGIVMPRSLKDFQAAVELFMKATGQDKKRVEFSGGISVSGAAGAPAVAISSEEAAEIASRLLAAQVKTT